MCNGCPTPFGFQTVVDSIGVSIWQMAAEPCNSAKSNLKEGLGPNENGHGNHINGGGDDDGSSGSEGEDDDDYDLVELHEQSDCDNIRLAVACDDGCVRLYNVLSTRELTYSRSLPRVSGEAAALFEILFSKFLL